VNSTLLVLLINLTLCRLLRSASLPVNCSQLLTLGTASCQHYRSPTLIRCACTKCNFHFIPCCSKSSLICLSSCFHCGQRLLQESGEQPLYAYEGNQSVAHHLPPPGTPQHSFYPPIIPGPLRPEYYPPLAHVCIFLSLCMVQSQSI
jgi:hypothetical protein